MFSLLAIKQCNVFFLCTEDYSRLCSFSPRFQNQKEHNEQKGSLFSRLPKGLQQLLFEAEDMAEKLLNTQKSLSK